MSRPKVCSSPASAASLADAGLPAADYSDGFEVSRASVWSAGQWARTTFEGPPVWVRRGLWVGWVLGLRLRLGPLSAADRILGWQIRTCTDALVVLSTDSRVLGRARLVWQVDGPQLILNTVIAFRTRPSRWLWAVVAPVHRLIIRALLARAAS